MRRTVPPHPSRPRVSTTGARQAPDRRLAGVITAAVWVLIVFMIVPADLNYRDFNAAGSTSGPFVLFPIISLGTVVLLWRRSLAALLFRRINPFFLAFLVLALVSTAWSADPAVTVRRLIRLYAIVSISYAFVLVGWSPRRFQRSMRVILTLVLVGSLVFGIVAPNLAIEQLNQAELVGAWHGLAMQKNPFGIIAALGSVFWLHAWLTRETTALRCVLGCAVAGLCLVLSRSSTSLLATLLSVCLLLLMCRAPTNLRRWMPYFVGLFCTVVFIYSVAVLKLIPGSEIVLAPISAVTGKDTTFSKRTDVWKIMNEQIAQHPLLGDGYGAFWRGPIPGTPSYQFIERLYVYPSEAHNGYLDIMNDLGLLGVACLVAYLYVFLKQSLRLMRFDRAQGSLYLALLFLSLVGNLSESLWFSVATVNFAIMTLATMALARGLLQYEFDASARRSTPEFRPQRAAKSRA